MPVRCRSGWRCNPSSRLVHWSARGAQKVKVYPRSIGELPEAEGLSDGLSGPVSSFTLAT